VTVPVHTGDLARGTLRSIIAQAGLTLAEFVALL
jgi:predicted RNA binding protein YcfA (HicA-like mRNA interferase family)